MEVYLFGISPRTFEKFETDTVSNGIIKQKMRQLGIRKAKVVVWYDRDPSPDEWGIVSI